jgi:geranylgeranyl diphosphate synthase, type I
MGSEEGKQHLEHFVNLMRPSIEEELQQAVSQAGGEGLDELHEMLAYHMGWTGEGSGPAAQGKRIRPLLTLLSAAASGGDWKCALPAAAAIELVHNFSLIHDDIEDDSPLRRGRPTLWTKWGIPQAINAGDALFTLAHLTLLRVSITTSEAIALEAARILQWTCLRLTQGQYLDIAFEQRGDLHLDAYWQMVSGKTAALLGSCTELGALASGSSDETRLSYQKFGHYLGLAFQALDDLLGIWGDSNLTGKSAESDLLTGKKSLPVLYGLAQNGPFAERWSRGNLTASEAPDLARQLEEEGAREYTRQNASRLTGEALEALDTANPQGEAGAALITLAAVLLSRQI